ncbi:MAG: ABC transporter permease [Candidatus Brockarchaeota archaeon]|nr:ABC transporter permease [Candidatus Brockarchaeota archaeon]
MGLRAELKVAVVVMKKELVLYFRYPVWVIFDALMPLLWVLSLVIYGRALVGSPYSANLARLTNTGDYVSFTIVGMIVSSFAYSTLWGMSYALRGEQWSGTLESTFLAPCSRFYILLGKAFSSMLTTTVWVSLQITLVAFVFGLNINILNLPLALLFFTIALPSFLGIGFSLAGVVLDFKEHNAFVNFLSSLLGLLLPISYPLSVLPSVLRYFSYLLPPTYAIEGMRRLLVMDSSLDEMASLAIPLVFFDAFWILVGVIVFIREERKVLKKGTLGYY